jgi:hypothetical protein
MLSMECTSIKVDVAEDEVHESGVPRGQNVIQEHLADRSGRIIDAAFQNYDPPATWQRFVR